MTKSTKEPRCHCGWALPGTIHIARFAPSWRDDVRIPRPPDQLDIVIDIMCPHCGCGFSHEATMTHMDTPITTTSREVFKA